MMLRNTKPAHAVMSATFGEPPAFACKSPWLKGVRGRGVKYEAAVQKHLRALYGEFYLPGPWIYFCGADGRLRYCQPDGILFDFQRGRIIICEIKLRHTPQAWYQLYEVYKPVLQKMFPGHLWSIRCMEICKWYDVATAFPAPHQLREHVEDCSADIMGVHIYAAD